jgi:hypothetical protein
MSTVKAKNHQIGSDGTASNNFTIYQPSTPDGTIRIGQGVAGAITSDIVTISSSGIKLASTAAPAFSAYMSSSQTVTTSTWTKANFNTEEFDTGNCYNNSTYEFTPTVAGYYQVNIQFTFGGTSPTNVGMALYKNGSVYKYLSLLGPSFGNGGILQNSCLVYLNGSTDYISAYGFCTASGTVTLSGGVQQSAFQASLVRSA